MESFKELMRGLMGIHLLDETTRTYSAPNRMRQAFGILLVCIFGPAFILGPIIILAVFVIFILNGDWLFAIPAVLIGIFALGLNSIPCWIFIDWEKSRLKTKNAK